VRCVAVDLAQVHAARDAFARFGKGRDAAGLNYGDCFAYALATVAQAPLLFKGDDFECRRIRVTGPPEYPAT